MTTHIITKYYDMHLHYLSSSRGVSVYYNSYTLFNIVTGGFNNLYGDGDKDMDLTDEKGMKIIGVDLI